MQSAKSKKDVGAKRTLLRRGAFFRCGTHTPPHPPRREARQPQKAGKRGAGVARAFTSAQPQQAGPFAEKEGQGSGATAAFLRLMQSAKSKKDVGAKRTLLRRGAFFRCGTHTPPHPPRREARQPQKAGKRGAGVARAFTSAQPQQAGPFAEKEGQGSGATAAFCGRCNLSKAKKTSEQSGLCSDVARLAGFEPATYRFVAGHSIH